MIRKSGNRFSEKNMLNYNARVPIDFFALSAGCLGKLLGGLPRRRLSRTRIGSEERRQLGDQSAAKRALRIGRRGMIHHFPAVDQDTGMIERAFEVRARMQTLMEKRVAEIGPVSLGSAAE